MTTQLIINADCKAYLKTIADNTYDSCVTDPPYGISFMNKHWDYNVPDTETWKEILRVLKPGAHILVACGTRTQHRMAINIEDAGFEIRDVITWHYGSGFPKSMDISKAIDKHFGADREVIGKREHPTLKDKSKIDRESNHQFHGDNNIADEWDITAPATNQAKAWQGWGTALKPATEFWTLARKPLAGTVAQNMLQHGIGGLNIDACRIPFVNDADKESAVFGTGVDFTNGRFAGGLAEQNDKRQIQPNDKGRYPANLILDEFAAAELDRQAPNAGAYAPVKSGQNGQSQGVYGDYAMKGDDGKSFYNDNGGASRFFYCAKADSYERNKGLNGFELKEAGIKNDSGRGFSERDPYAKIMRRNIHPTVKPIDLMRYLVKLITPKYGHVLDPFNGTGTTGIAAKLELMNYTGIEIDAGYCKISEARIAAWNPPKFIEQSLF